MFHKALYILACVVSAGFLYLGSVSTVYASGSFSGGFGNEAEDERRKLYHQGKRIFKKQLVCKTCPYADTSVKRDNASEFLNRALNEQQSLSVDEKTALVAYFARRYRVKN